MGLRNTDQETIWIIFGEWRIERVEVKGVSRGHEEFEITYLLIGSQEQFHLKDWGI